MSAENVEIVRRGYAAISRGDWDAVFEAAHPDFQWTTAEQVPNAGVYRGRAEARSFFEDQRSAFDGWTVEPEEFFEGDNQVVAFIKIRARPRGSDAEFEITIGHLWTLEDGKVVSGQAFPKREQALEAAGLEK